MSAIISECGKYRYRLERSWPEGNQEDKACFIMLNPSTADATQNDPTIRRCIGFAKAWGYGGLVVVNLFAFRATNPDELYEVDDPVGRDNDAHILNAVEHCKGAVCAWGVKGHIRNRHNNVRRMIGMPLYYLALTKGGNPSHPLYLKSELKPQEWI